MQILYVKFGKSKSKQYSKALNLAKQFSHFLQKNNIIECYIDNILEYCKIQNAATELIHIVHGWKNSTVLFFAKPYQREIDFSHFLTELKKKAGEYAPLIRDRVPVDVAIDNTITYEDLPLPIVYYPSSYGVFFAFSEKIGDKIFFCECQRKSIEKAIALRRVHPLVDYSGSKTNPLSSSFFPQIVSELSKRNANDPLALFGFKEHICFRCNNKIPSLKYCDPMYGGVFRQRYGWYINQEMIDWEIDPRSVALMHLSPEYAPHSFLNQIRKITALLTNQKSVKDVTTDIIGLQKSFKNAIENVVREQYGYPRIGDKWISETMLFHIVKAIYPNETIKRHYRPDWLEGLELDIYIPTINLAFEYQGIQHFKAIDHWGGQQQLKKQQEHDQRKKHICEHLGIRLICVSYDEELSDSHIRNSIESNE